MSIIIKVTGLSKYYYSSAISKEKKKKITALEKINIEIEEGSGFAIVGPNAAGKTTLIKIICGLVHPSTGYVEVMGNDAVKDSKVIRNSLGLISPEDRSLYMRLTGYENLEFYARLYGLNRQQISKKIEYLTGLLNLNPDINNALQNCSTGIKHRFSIARALINDPAVLLLDEPAKSLDPDAAASLHEFIIEELIKRQKKTVVFTSHSLKEVEKLADEVAFIEAGCLKGCGTMGDLKKEAGLQDNSTPEDVYRAYIGN
ncbi:ABC transporter ATP-binding protein [Elusimicrobiota bacterium]